MIVLGAHRLSIASAVACGLLLIMIVSRSSLQQGSATELKERIPMPFPTLLGSQMLGEVGSGEEAVTKPTFDWTDENLDLFLQACDTGDKGACETIVRSDEALAKLNARKDVETYTVRPRMTTTGNRFKTDFKPLYAEWDEMVPLAEPISQREFEGRDAGNVLIPADQVKGRPQVKKEALAFVRAWRGQQELVPVMGEKLIDNCCIESNTFPEPAPRAAAVNQAPQDPCAPGGPLCGPVRPDKDYGADIVLTKGWLGENENKKCCPCLGKGAKRINYGDYYGAGFYNAYTMEMCTPCDGCETA